MPLNIISQPELLTTAVCRGDPRARPRDARPGGRPPPCSTQHGLSPVHWAVQEMGHVDVLKLLLARGGSANSATNEASRRCTWRRARAMLTWRARCLAAGADARARSRDKEDAAGPRRRRRGRAAAAACATPSGRRAASSRPPAARLPPATAPAAPPPTAVGPETVAAAQWRAIRAVRRHGAALAAAPFATRTFATDPSAHAPSPRTRPTSGRERCAGRCSKFIRGSVSPRRPMPRRRLERATCAWRASVRSRKATFSR